MRALLRALFFAAFSCLLCLSCFAYAEPQTSAAACVLMDARSGEILYERNAHQPMSVASTTKIMTALVALEHGKLSDELTVTPAHMVEGSSMYLKVGDTLKLETLLYGLLLSSGNDAALVIAEHCGGSVEGFAALMNEKARELGMTETSFANPSGLETEGHYSTAHDMALLTAYAMRHPILARIMSTKAANVGGYALSNHNKLLSRVDGCIGGKTGYTSCAGRTLVSCAERDGTRLVAVTLRDGNDWIDHAALYEYGFSAAAEESEKEVLAAWKSVCKN